jgi:MYXO-CTERM domain-containing protein
MRTYLTAAVVLAAAGVASAQVWNESGDAGQDGVGAAQATVGSGALSSIVGTVGLDVDLYQIRITDIAGFTASTVGGAAFDTQLFLFAADGTGITENDDENDTFSLQSRINSDGLIGTGAAPGIFYLAITSFNNQPLDGDGLGMFSFDVWPGSGDQRSPVSAGSLTSWNGSGFEEGDYSISLTGAEYSVPAPASLALLGLGGLAAVRRRR